jgi:DNA ligase-1
VFDIPDPCAGTYAKRYATLCQLGDRAHIKIITQEQVTSRDVVETLFHTVVERGGEGVMMMDPYSLYRDGPTDHLLKYKKIIDDEAIIIGYNPGNGRNAGKLGSFIVHPIEDGEPVPKREFSIAGITDEIRTNYKRTHPIGTVICYRCN